MVGPESLDENAHHRGAQARLGDRALGEDLPEVAVDVVHAVLLRDFGEVVHPVHAAGAVELLHADLVGAAGVTESRVVDDEIKLRPVLGRLAYVAHVGIGQQLRELPGGRRRVQSLVHADVDEARFRHLLVEGIEQLLVVHVPRVPGQMLVGVVAHRIALEGIGLQLRDCPVHGVHPARHAGLEDRVGKHAPRAGQIVHFRARIRLHFVGKEPVARLLRSRARNERDLGVAVEVDFLEVVRELEVFERLRLADQRRVPAGLAHGFARAHEIRQPGVVAQEVRVHVHDELVGEGPGALVRHVRRRGLGAAHAEVRAVDVVHRGERRRHAGSGLEEFAPAHALVPG